MAMQFGYHPWASSISFGNFVPRRSTLQEPALEMLIIRWGRGAGLPKGTWQMGLVLRGSG